MTFDPASTPHEHARVLHLDDVDRLSLPNGLTWLPIRHTLDLHAFGTNAYEAGHAGQVVIEPHVENLERAHQELYFVARGRARFILDGHEHDAPAGTYVFVPDPRMHRHAIAEEAGTIVLSFGGPPTYVPSVWESAFRALARANSDPVGARKLLREAIADHPDDASLLYNAACVEALLGDREAAFDYLGQAIERNPECAAWARDDTDFAQLADAEPFRTLVGASS